MLELRHLQVLRAIASEGSLAGAARSLGLRQPTIAHHLTTLETHFGVGLVERTPRGAALSEAGRVLLAHAEAVLTRVELAEREVRAAVKFGRACVHLGTFPSAGALLMPPAVKQLRTEGVQVSILEGELPILLAGLRSGELNAALVFSQPGDRLDLGEEFLLHTLLFDPLLLILPADHPLAGRERVALGELRAERWIVGTTEWDPCDRLLTWACAREGFEPLHEMRTDDYGVIQGFVAAGVGVALIPRLGLNYVHEGVVVRQLEGYRLSRRVGLAVTRSTVTPGIDRLLEALHATVGDLARNWGTELGLGASYAATTRSVDTPGSAAPRT